ncbi:MAG TPA: acetyl-CoA carboxylase carboxyl transferase subunit alpha, partial [Lysobacter sp.]|nr:acetyl-CoA carboxylase carboxyl transferase subunit alpha [Lysobacter sp.]
MNPNYLDFEQPIADLEAKIQELRHASYGSAVDADAEIHALQNKLRIRTAQIFRDLNSWQVSQLARHPARPYTMDYLRVICDEFQELAGDRAFANDQAIVGGLARIDGRSMVVI